MSEKTMIGIGGFAGAGKDTLADKISEKAFTHLVSCQKLPMAYPLKRQVSLLYHLSEEQLNSELKAKQTEMILDKRVLDLVLRSEFHWLLTHSQINDLVEAYLGVIEDHFDVRHHRHSPIYQFKATPRRILQVHGTEFARNKIQDDVWVVFHDRQAKQMHGEVILVPDIRFKDEAGYIMERGYLAVVDRPNQRTIADKGHASEGVHNVLSLADKVITNEEGKAHRLDDYAEDIVAHWIL